MERVRMESLDYNEVYLTQGMNITVFYLANPLVLFVEKKEA